MANPNVAIIGLEASGKTVLMTVLAKRLSQSVQKGYFLDPVGSKTIKYIENMWETLQCGDWPPSTAPGEMFNLHWRMRIVSGYAQNTKPCAANVHLVDAAGQDMRLLFSDDIPLNEVPAYLQPLAQYFSQASILLIILNIKDYVGETNIARKTENQATIKSALDVLQKEDRKIAFIFTQMDQYQDYLTSCGGLAAFCEKHLPYVYNAYMANQSNAVLSVAAVNDTEISETTDGTVLRVPVKGFSSVGIEEIGDWLAEQVVEFCLEEQVKVDAEQEQQRLSALRAERARQQEYESRRNVQQTQTQTEAPSASHSSYGCTFLIIILIVVGWFFHNGGSLDFFKEVVSQTKMVLEPAPQVLDKNGVSTCNQGFFDCWSHNAEVSAVIYNPGKADSFEVEAKLFVADVERYSDSQTIYLDRNGSYRCVFEFNNINFCANKIQWSYSITAKRIEKVQEDK